MLLVDLIVPLLLALVQGAMEFLPVSSSGHLTLLAGIAGAPADTLLVVTVLHIATAIAAIVYYRHRYWRALQELRAGQRGRQLPAPRYILAQLPTAAIAGLFTLALTQPAVYHWWVSPWFIGIMMLVNAAILAAAPAGRAAPDDGRMPVPAWRAALAIGLAQGIAVVPGLSRSGLTVTAGLAAGLNRNDAVHFSMLLAPPVILGSAIVRAMQIWPEPLLAFATWQAAAITAIMTIAAFAIALAALHWTVAWVRAGRLRWFAPWSLAAGSATLLFAALSA